MSTPIFSNKSDIIIVIQMLKTLQDKLKREGSYVYPTVNPSINRVIFDLEELKEKAGALK